MVDLEYYEVPPTKWTFEPDVMREYVQNNLEGRTLNLFCGKTYLHHPNEDSIIRNDIDESIDADFHFNATEVREYVDDQSFGTVILDPPYNVRKSREKYSGVYQGALKYIKDQLQTIVRPGGIVIHFGYDTTGMSKSRGFKKEQVAVFNHKGDHNDTLSVIDRRMNTGIADYD